MSSAIHVPQEWRKETDGRKLVKTCQKKGARVEFGKGDHVNVHVAGEQRPMTIPYRELGHGLAQDIIKWMVKVGIIASIVLIAWEVFSPVSLQWTLYNLWAVLAGVA